MQVRTRWTNLAAAFVALTLFGTAGAQSSTRKEARFGREWGATLLNGYLRGVAHAGLDDTPYTAADGSQENVYVLSGGANAEGGITVLLQRLEAFRFEADASLRDDTGQPGVVDLATHGLMRIGGRTLLSFDRGWPLQDNQSFGPYSLVTGGINKGISIGIFAVSVHADAAGSIEGQARIGVDRGEQGGTASIGFRARQYAAMGANIHFWPFEAGVESTLDLPVVAAQAKIRTDLQDGVRGELLYAVDPISLVARAFGCINLPFFRECATYTFLNWSSQALSGNVPLR